MLRFKMSWAMMFTCMTTTLAINDKEAIPKEIKADKVSETKNVFFRGTNLENYPKDDESVISSLMSNKNLNRRMRREIRTLVDMQRDNARKLDDIIRGVNKLVQSAGSKVDMQKDNAKKLDGIANGVNNLVQSANSTDNLNPFFVPLFVMLADVFQSTSPRIAKSQTDFVNILDYFLPNIVSQQDSQFLRNNLDGIVNWYVGNFTSCVDILNAGHTQSGVYILRMQDTYKSINVYCDQETDGGGWLVFQRRQDGSVDFYRSWEDYRRGFGNISAEFWLGNDVLHELTKSQQQLRVDLLDFSRNKAYAKYSSFSVGSLSESFALSIHGYSGTAGDSMVPDNGAGFVTEDGGTGNRAYAKSYKGPWWHKSGYYSNLNGMYFDSETSSTQSLSWYHWKSAYLSLKGSEMKIRPKL